MVLKDVFCEVCGAWREELVDRDETRWAFGCETCRSLTIHVSRCTGGTGKRYRAFDVCSNYDPSADCKYLGGSESVDEGTGEVTRRGHGAEKLDARRDEIRSDRRRKRGAAPLYFFKR